MIKYLKFLNDSIDQELIKIPFIRNDGVTNYLYSRKRPLIGRININVQPNPYKVSTSILVL